ncbi:MAG: hypothetical protein WBY44_32740 [Bryobacteraceae bacterium]
MASSTAALENASLSSLPAKEANYSSRLQLELTQHPPSQVLVQLAKDLESAISYRTKGEITASEFFIQLKRLEYSITSASGISREAFIEFVLEDLELSRARKEIVTLASKLTGHGKDLSPALVSEASHLCVMAWRSALLDAERDARSGRLVSQILIGCLLIYLLVAKTGPVILEAKVPFAADLIATSHRPFWDLATESVSRIMSFWYTSGELVPVILGMAGAALNLFRKGVRNFEINIMFGDQSRWAVAVHLAIGAWSGFVANYLLRSVSTSLSVEALRNFISTVGCFAAGYSSWFVDSTVARVWQKIELRQRPTSGANS